MQAHLKYESLKGILVVEMLFLRSHFSAGTHGAGRGENNKLFKYKIACEETLDRKSVV